MLGPFIDASAVRMSSMDRLEASHVLDGRGINESTNYEAPAVNLKRVCVGR